MWFTINVSSKPSKLARLSHTGEYTQTGKVRKGREVLSRVRIVCRVTQAWDWIWNTCIGVIRLFILSSLYYIVIQVAGAGIRGPLLICLLNLTLNAKLSSYSSQFKLKYHILLNSLWVQIRDHIYRSLGLAAIYYTTVRLEKSNREQTDREQRKQLQRPL